MFSAQRSSNVAQNFNQVNSSAEKSKCSGKLILATDSNYMWIVDTLIKTLKVFDVSLEKYRPDSQLDHPLWQDRRLILLIRHASIIGHFWQTQTPRWLLEECHREDDTDWFIKRNSFFFLWFAPFFTFAMSLYAIISSFLIIKPLS